MSVSDTSCLFALIYQNVDYNNYPVVLPIVHIFSHRPWPLYMAIIKLSCASNIYIYVNIYIYIFIYPQAFLRIVHICATEATVIIKPYCISYMHVPNDLHPVSPVYPTLCPWWDTEIIRPSCIYVSATYITAVIDSSCVSYMYLPYTWSRPLSLWSLSTLDRSYHQVC